MRTPIKTFIPAIAFVLSFCLAFGSSAATISELEKEKEKQEKSASEKNIKAAEIQSSIENINDQLQALAEDMDKAQSGILTIERQMELMDKELNKMEREKETTGKKLKNFIGQFYRNRYKMNIIAVFLRSRSISDFINQQKYAISVAEHFNDALVDYANRDAEMKVKEKEFAELKTSVEAERKELDKKQQEFDDQIEDLNKSLEKVIASRDKAWNEADELQEQIEAMEEAERIALEERTRAEEETWDTGIIRESSDVGYFYVDPYKHTDTELTLLAGIIEAEAGSTSYPGMVAVGSVVMNRVADKRFANTISGVIYAPHQFSPVASGRLAVILARGPASSCIGAARDVLDGKRNVKNFYFKAKWYAEEHGISGIDIGGNVFH